MIAHAHTRFVHEKPMKVRQIIDLIRGRDVNSAMGILAHVTKDSTKMIQKTLNSAVSNAKQKGLSEDQLFISKIIANPGPMWKRYRAAAFGRATPILKRTTHLSIELDVAALRSNRQNVKPASSAGTKSGDLTLEKKKGSKAK